MGGGACQGWVWGSGEASCRIPSSLTEGWSSQTLNKQPRPVRRKKAKPPSMQVTLGLKVAQGRVTPRALCGGSLETH